jgi:hypothetical protein
VIAVALRAGAHGLYADEAACELLISHAIWLHRHDFTARFLHAGISITDGTDLAHIDWPAAITALDAAALPCSSSEGKMLRLAASLGAGIPVNLRDALVGLDQDNLRLVQQAVLRTGGHRPSH